MARYEDDEEYIEERPRRRRTETSNSQVADQELAADESRESALRRRLRERTEHFSTDDEDDDTPDTVARAAYTPAYQRGSSGCAAMVLYTLLGVLAIVLVMLIVLPRILSSAASAVPVQIAQIVASPTPTIRDRGGTIQQIRNLNRLETQSYSVERVVEASSQRGNALDLVLGEKLLLIASGTVIAGVDLSQLQPQDVTISPDGGSITINLPRSEIFLSALDSTRTRVYDKQTGIGTRLFGGENKDLESQARQNAEVEILRAACEGGVMQKAADEARHAIEQFLQLLEFERINVNAPAGQCVAPQTAPVLPAATP